MNSKKPPADDTEKTVMVGSGRRWPVPATDEPVSPPADRHVSRDDVAGASDDKTQFVGDRTVFVPEGSRADADDAPPPQDDPLQGRLRSDPQPRLSWPARDINFVEREGQQMARPGEVPTQQPPARGGDDERTRLYNPAAAAQEARAEPAPQAASRPVTQTAAEPHDDPVVGWLVVVDGPGKGRSVEIGIGANAVGREKGQKLRIDFGDQHISREKHAIVVFDPRSRKFFLQGGDVRNLTYIDDNLVLSPTELRGGETIMIGNTKLRFVALCGPDFGWA